MTLTIGQKLKIALVRLVMNIIWMLDVFAAFLAKNLLLQSLWHLAIVAFIFYALVVPFFRANPLSVYKKQVGLLQNEITYQINGNPSILASIGKSQMAVLGTSTGNSHIPVLTNKSAFPYLSAQAHIIVDNNSGKVLSEQNIQRTYAPASTTKMMTALVAKDLYSFDDILQIPGVCADVESTKLWLPIGDFFYVKDLMSSLLISSAGDAGCTLAVSEISQEEFVELMNLRAEELGMYDTNFTNPIGLDGDNGSNYSTVWDLYILSKELMSVPELREIVSLKEYSFSNVDNSLEIDISSTNKLLWDIPGSVGIKTGTTTGAGEVLVYRFMEGKTDLTIVVMASANRFLDTKNLLDWTLSSYTWN